MVKQSNSEFSTYTLSLDSRTLTFNLKPNASLLKNIAAQGKQSEMLVLKGEISNESNSWARFTERDGVITGAFYDDSSLYLVERLDKIEDAIDQRGRSHDNVKQKNNLSKTTVLIDVNDIKHSGTCALHDHKIQSRFTFDEYIGELKQLVAPSATKEINITLVADTEYVEGSTDATADMIGILNIADGIFSEQLGVQLALADTVELDNNGLLTSTDPQILIGDFRTTDIPNPGIRHLFTGKDLNGSTVGIAYVGALCYQAAVGITQRFGTLTPIIFTHELGHNFGAPHDNQAGSNCSTTPSGFIMNPSVSRGLNQFSNCSIAEMNPFIELATTGFSACITEIEVPLLVPMISSTANVVANVDEAYEYDNDGMVDVETSSAVTFALDIFPTGMVINDIGLVSWTPTSDQIGKNAVQVSVFNDNGQDTQYFEVEVKSDFINFNELLFSSFGDQYKFGDVNLGVTPFQIELTGNNWKSIPFNYSVTTNTLLEFEFESDVGAEIHGIAFENDNDISRKTTFNLYGSQKWGVQAIRYSQFGENQPFSIPVGQFFQGAFNQLVFVLDNDGKVSGANAIFKNVKVYEDSSDDILSESLDLNTLTFYTDLPKQDLTGTVTISDDGKAVELVGNRWRKVFLDDIAITPTTVIEFDFKSTNIGDIHGLGFLPGSALERTLSFKLHGTQRWGINDFKYTGNGEYQRFYIPVGQYFTQDKVELVFIMDHDVRNPNGDSTFRNIVIRNTADND